MGRDTSNGAERINRARRLLSGGGVEREDSDDELGVEDHPWEWLYDDCSTKAFEPDNASRVSEGNLLHSDNSKDINTPLRSARERNHSPQFPNRKIVGARMGDFYCKIGDCVLLKAESSNEAWVGLISEFFEDDEEGKAANFMWFSTEKEIRNKHKKRTDFLQNELYITPSWDINPLTSINGRATVCSLESFLTNYPNGKVSRSSTDFGKVFVCRRACNTRTATYSDEFDWNSIYQGSEEDIYALIEKVKTETKAARKKSGPRKQDLLRNQDQEFVDCDPSTPKIARKRRKIDTEITTPSRKRRDFEYLTTPSNRRVLVKKPLEFIPLGTRTLSPSALDSSPFQLARTKLHVSAVPATMPCREEEFSIVFAHLEGAISDGSGACIYISGTPGTGKTATMREIIRQLHASVLAEELEDFIFVEINGMKLTDPHQSYSLLWEALRGERVSPVHALELLEREFSKPSPRRVPCVVLMDELDQLVTKNQSVMYNFFNWPGLRHSRLIVLAVANTMDLPERTLSNKISSRLGLVRVTFPGYTHDQLMKIIQSRLEGVPGKIVDPDAVQFASRKVAAVSGDARRALDICRRAVELAEATRESNIQTTQSTTDTKAFPNISEQVMEHQPKVTITTIKEAISEATTSPLQQYLRGISLSSKLFLAALLARIRRTGTGESVLGDVIEEARKIGRMSENQNIQALLLVGTSGYSTGLRYRNISVTVPRVQTMIKAAIELMEAGIVGLESRKGDRKGKVRLNVGNEDIKLAFREDPEVRDLGFST
ncbi:P-loop containing nucleoside triphosphate hydrolase protein [Xylona heveae TC161]|uniref:Origin recognition complex subunit 1 n=1 Tax=Xylona heveae (strain CBS 132557 / TC161) TaxID=1328760 RepID=A0A165JJ68_XYLHT|nr:P-loop containing nucleoside triphosphate hydrolase protein [Xylona heveae TC161]KZF26309.1 P-loop containing nucleoside triphosphate hydrolase protein [Xylona heveae TC161]